MDLFSLRAVDLYAIEISGHRFGKNAQTVVEALQKSRSLPLSRWIYAMGIPTVGVTTARKIARGEIKPESAIQAEIDAYLARLKALGIEPVEPEENVLKEGPLVGMGCVLTGTLSRPREEYAALILAAGGIVQSSVTKKTRYLIAGENTGSTKTEKARKLGTEVIDENRLKELLG